jgi:S-(hydroxymethyl)glutathione dehydrogenase/alcohol dehydrogenase
VVLDERGRLPTLTTVSVAPAETGEARVRMRAAGVCHTDLSAVKDARTVPLVLGHEGMGVVESVGPGGNEDIVGTRVLLSWKTPCGECRRCKPPRSHLSTRPLPPAGPRISRGPEPLGVLLDTGCFCDYVVVPEAACVAVPPQLSDRHAALVGCAVATGVGAALYTARIDPGDTVAVWGAGGVGLYIVSGARLRLASTIVAVDPVPERREAALARGATLACPPEAAVSTIEEATQGDGVDVAFEVVGDAELMATAIDTLGVGGMLVLVGAAARDAVLSFQPRRFMSRQQRLVGCIYGSVRPRFDLPTLLALCAAGEVPLDDLDGQTIALDDVPEAFASPPGGVRPVVSFE